MIRSGYYAYPIFAPLSYFTYRIGIFQQNPAGISLADEYGIISIRFL
jgi:hypothetical protein